MRPRLNSAQVGLLVERYQQGKTVYELGAEFGIARQTVSVILKRNDVPLRMQGLRERRAGRSDPVARTGMVVCAAGDEVRYQRIDSNGLPAPRRGMTLAHYRSGRNSKSARAAERRRPACR